MNIYIEFPVCNRLINRHVFYTMSGVGQSVFKLVFCCFSISFAYVLMVCMVLGDVMFLFN